MLFKVSVTLPFRKYFHTSLNIVLLFNNSEYLAVSLSSLSISFSLHLFPSSYFLRILAENTNCIFGDRLAYADEKKQPQHLCGLKQEFTFCLSYDLQVNQVVPLMNIAPCGTCVYGCFISTGLPQQGKTSMDN